MKKKVFSALFCVIIIISSLSSCYAKKPQRFQAEFLALFDTVTRIIGYAENKEAFEAFAGKVYQKLEAYHKLYDIYNEYEGLANIKTINNAAGKQAVKVDKRIIDLLLFSKDMYQKTDGAVNVAFGAVLVLWHNAREAGVDNPENAALPDLSALNEAAGHCDIERMVIDEDAQSVFLTDEQMRLDVGAIAKGYAVEMTARELEAEGCESLLISVGGNVRAIGGKYSDKTREYDKDWQVGVQNPDKSAGELFSVLVSGKSVVTSGVYERYYTVDGKRYHHIINKDTLFPADYYISLTVICPDSGLADALTTALFNMPLEDSEKAARAMGAFTAWVLPDGTVKYSEGFEALLAE